MKKSRRYCLTCRKVTTFKLRLHRKNKEMPHSKCSECGGWKALSKSHAKSEGYTK